MAKITQAQVEKTYEIAIKVYNGQLDKNQGAKILEEQHNLNYNSAFIYIENIGRMLKGQVYKRAMKEADTEYFLTMIEKAFGLEELKKALHSIKQHIQYIHSINKSSNVENLYSCFMKKNNFTDSSEANNILESESSADSNSIPVISQNFIYEEDLQNSLVRQAEELFPGYKIYGDDLDGIEYQIEGKRVDLLLENEKENKLLAIELKANVADFKVYGQISMYLNLLEMQFPDKKIEGVIIAGEIDNTLKLAARKDQAVKLKSYKMSLELVEE